MKAIASGSRPTAAAVKRPRCACRATGSKRARRNPKRAAHSATAKAAAFRAACPRSQRSPSSSCREAAWRGRCACPASTRAAVRTRARAAAKATAVPASRRACSANAARGSAVACPRRAFRAPIATSSPRTAAKAKPSCARRASGSRRSAPHPNAAAHKVISKGAAYRPAFPPSRSSAIDRNAARATRIARACPVSIRSPVWTAVRAASVVTSRAMTRACSANAARGSAAAYRPTRWTQRIACGSAPTAALPKTKRCACRTRG